MLGASFGTEYGESIGERIDSSRVINFVASALEPPLFLLVCQLPYICVCTTAKEDASSLWRVGDLCAADTFDGNRHARRVEFNILCSCAVRDGGDTNQNDLQLSRHIQQMRDCWYKDTWARSNECHCGDEIGVVLVANQFWVGVRIVPKIQSVVNGHVCVVDLGKQAESGRNL